MWFSSSFYCWIIKKNREKKRKKKEDIFCLASLSSVSCRLSSLLDTGVVCSRVTFSSISPLPLFSPFLWTAGFKKNQKENNKKKEYANFFFSVLFFFLWVYFFCFVSLFFCFVFCLSRMQLAHMLFLSVCFTLYYHTHLLQLLHSTANVSEQVTPRGSGPCRGRGATENNEQVCPRWRDGSALGGGQIVLGGGQRDDQWHCSQSL